MIKKLLFKTGVGVLLLSLSAFASNVRKQEADALISTDHSKNWALPAASDTLTGRDSTDTFTNKSLSGSSNTFTNIPAASAISGQLPVANGGTGSSSLTSGAVVLGNGSSPVTTVSPGTSGNVLTSNGSTWASSPSGVLATSVVTTSTTMAAGHRYIVNDASTATMTLPSSCAQGDEIAIVGVGAGGWLLSSNASATAQTVNEGSVASQTSSSSAVTLFTYTSVNDTIDLICVLTDSVWNAVSYIGTHLPFITATGGTVTTDGDYKVHIFNSSGTFTITGGYGQLETLVIGGGGGGGSGDFNAANGGGGAAGGFVHTSPGAFYGAGAYTVTVGAGGASDTNGSNSAFDSIIATGGGRGAHNGSAAGNGGSGGGGNSGGGATATSKGTSTGGGHDGGDGAVADPNSQSGGGGGALTAGQDAGAGGNGGDGMSSSITGSPVDYAGGGGGGHNSGSGGNGGLGGGGAGAGVGQPGGNGAANTGSGGGGGSFSGPTAGGTAGDGFVAVRYKFQ